MIETLTIFILNKLWFKNIFVLLLQMTFININYLWYILKLYYCFTRENDATLYGIKCSNQRKESGGRWDKSCSKYNFVVGIHQPDHSVFVCILINKIKFFVQCNFNFIDEILGVQIHSFFDTKNNKKKLD